MPLDPEVAAAYEEAAASHPFRRVRHVPVDELRRHADAFGGDGTPALPRVENHAAPGPAGPVAVRLYAPSTEHLPVLIWIYGGGWTFGSLDGTEGQCRRLAAATGCAVVALDYRKAPEHRFPAAVEDVVAAAEWVAANADALGLDGSRIAMGGISAGANLAAVACLVARDRGAPSYALQLLVAPVLDDDLARPSMLADADPTLAAADVAYVIEQYLGHPPPANDPLAFPTAAASLAGLAPACIVPAELEPIRDGALAYAERLERDGTPVQLHVVPGVGHSFFGMPLPAGEVAVAVAVEAVRAALAPTAVA